MLSAILNRLKSHPDFGQTGIKQYRLLLDRSSAVFKLPRSIKTDAISINGIDGMWMIPENYDPERAILFTHGGGFIAGSIQSHKDLAARIAIAAEAKVLVYNYRLAPEHPFPEGLEDVKTIYRWFVENTFSNHICLAGDSSGGGLTTALLAELLRQKQQLPVCSVLLSPWVDLECKNESHLTKDIVDPMLNTAILKKTARLYSDRDLSHPLISPINNDFTGLTPVLIQTGENEILLADSRLLAEKLENKGVHVELNIYKHMFHVWHYFAKYLSESRMAIQKIGQFIKQWT